MEAVSTCETLVDVYETTDSNIPEHYHLHSCRRDNLKSHSATVVSGVLKSLVPRKAEPYSQPSVLYTDRIQYENVDTSPSSVTTDSGSYLSYSYYQFQ
jgi:hypothetical protein